MTDRVRAMFDVSANPSSSLAGKWGYEASASQFLRKTTAPRLSMLRRFAKAMGVDVRELL